MKKIQEFIVENKILFIGALLTILILLLIGCFFKPKEKSLSTNDCHYPLEELEKEQFKQNVLLSLMPITKIFEGQNYNQFSDNEIAYFIASVLLINKEKATEETISNLVSTYFGIDNYHLKEGQYVLPNKEKVNISKEKDHYQSDLLGKENLYTSKIEKMTLTLSKEVILEGIYIKYINQETGEFQKLGNVTYLFEYQENTSSYVIKKITYKEEKR